MLQFSILKVEKDTLLGASPEGEASSDVDLTANAEREKKDDEFSLLLYILSGQKKLDLNNQAIQKKKNQLNQKKEMQKRLI